MVALKRIRQYLKGTPDKGLILNLMSDLTFDCYLDADFACLWGYEDSQDPHCIHSHTGYFINLCSCPILWASKLQMEIALSTMEAEYIMLSTAYKDLFPIVDVIKELCCTLGLEMPLQRNLHV